MFLTLRFLFLILYSKDDLGLIARKALIQDNSFDLPSTAGNDPLIGLRLLIRTLREISNEDYSPINEVHYVVAIDSQRRNWETHLNYCRLNGLTLFSEMYTSGEAFVSKSGLSKLWLSVVSISAFVIVLPFLLSRRRANYALCVRYAPQIESIRIKLKASRTKVAYDFAAYLNHSNWATLVYNSQGIRVVKIPSIVPLTAHLSSIISDVLMLSTPYQLEEYQFFSKSMRVGRIYQAYPKHAEYLKKYGDKHISSYLNCIGYYSHASWLRSKEKHVESQFALPAQEEVLIKYLSGFCLRANFRLMIFTHPRERRIEHRTEVENHYSNLIGSDVERTLYFDELPSSQILELAEIGVGTMSSVLFERLICGFKTLFFTENMTSFPLRNSSIKSICAEDLIALECLLQDAIGKNRIDYFQEKAISSYKYDSEFYAHQST